MFEMMPFAKTMMNPFYDIDQMSRNFFGNTPIQTFRTDVQETDTGYTLEAELPGFDRNDIHIDIDGDQLTIQAEHTDTNVQNNDRYLRRERYYGSYSRSFDISQIDGDDISASYENGVLKLDMPKKQVITPTSRRLEIH